MTRIGYQSRINLTSLLRQLSPGNAPGGSFSTALFFLAQLEARASVVNDPCGQTQSVPGEKGRSRHG
jgi:hypothetical protein